MYFKLEYYFFFLLYKELDACKILERLGEQKSGKRAASFQEIWKCRNHRKLLWSQKLEPLEAFFSTKALSIYILSTSYLYSAQNILSKEHFFPESQEQPGIGWEGV